MVRFMFIVRTNKGLRKVYCRTYSRSMPLLVNPNDGRNIDRSADIADAYHGDKDGLNTYFTTKESSIRSAYREDTNSAAADGVPASELREWQEHRDDLLGQLSDQRDDVFDLASVTDSDTDHDSDSDSVSDNNNLSPSDSNASSPNNNATGASNLNPVASNSNHSAYHAQDSSEVVQTDFSSFDPFED